MYKIIETVIAAMGILALIFLFLSGQGYRWEVIDLGQAFTVMRWSAYAGIAAAVLVVIYLLWRRPRGARLALLFIAGLMGLTAFYLPYQQQQRAGSVPPIHDITTNTDDPPAFVDILPLRADAPNPAEYAGEETARQQQEAYPDLMPMRFDQPMEEVFTAAMAVAEDMGWDIVGATQEEGRIEATATTRWFGFQDDVVIRLREGAGGQGTIVDVRSKSRVGRSDIGTNARRIRTFRDALNNRLAG